MSDLATFVGDRYYRSQFSNGLSSYLVFLNGGIIYADPLFPGGVPYSGSTAIQDAINALNSSGGGGVYVRAGIYSFSGSSQIVLKSGVKLFGEGDHTPFYGGA